VSGVSILIFGLLSLVSGYWFLVTGHWLKAESIVSKHYDRICIADFQPHAPCPMPRALKMTVPDPPEAENRDT
jgi:hypothetical protein